MEEIRCRTKWDLVRPSFPLGQRLPGLYWYEQGVNSFIPFVISLPMGFLILLHILINIRSNINGYFLIVLVAVALSA